MSETVIPGGVFCFVTWKFMCFPRLTNSWQRFGGLGVTCLS